MQNINQKVEEIRAAICTLQSERGLLNAQSRSRREVADYVHRQIAGRAASAEARLRLDLRRVAGGEHPDLLRADVTHREADVTIALVALLGVEVVEAALVRHLDEEVPVGLDAGARATRLAEIDDEIERLETAEEDLILESERAGAAVLRRADVSPWVVIGRHDPVSSSMPRSARYMQRPRVGPETTWRGLR
jgi:hypothetical protein